jgi:hypothetical protein
MRVGCGSAAIGMFAKQWLGWPTRWWWWTTTSPGCCPNTRPARCWTAEPTGIKIKGRRSTPGRYFQVAEPGTGWGGTDIDDPLVILGRLRCQGGLARPVAADGVHHRRAIRLFRAGRRPQAAAEGHARRLMASVELIEENCEPVCSVLFMGGGRQLARRRDRKPGALTRSVKDTLTRLLRRRTGLCLARRRHHHHGRRDAACRKTPSAMCRRRRWSRRSSSPCAVADYEALGGHMKHVMPLAEARRQEGDPERWTSLPGRRWPARGGHGRPMEHHFGWSKGKPDDGE